MLMESLMIVAESIVSLKSEIDPQIDLSGNNKVLSFPNPVCSKPGSQI